MDFKLMKPEVEPKIPYGQRLWAHTVDELAKEAPSRVLCKIAKSSDISKGFLEITAGQVAKAVDYMSYWLQDKLQDKNGQETTISYMGLGDIRYWVMELAAIKIGSPILLPSLKNSLANNESLFNNAKCRNLFYSEGNESRASGLASHINDLHTFQIPKWSDLVAQDSKPYPYNDTWETAAKKPVMILHTSGSTGNPKPIVLNNHFINLIDSGRLLPDVDGWEATGPAMFAQGPRSEYYLGFPFFHMGGLGLCLQPFWYDCVLVLGPTDVPANGKIIVDLLKYTKIMAIASPPSLLEDITKEYQDEFEKYCGNTKLVAYGGGPLGNFAGDYLSKHIPVMAQVMGSTEAGFIPLVSKAPEYWQAFQFHPDGGIVFEQNPADPDLYELVIKRLPDPEHAQGIFINFPDIDVWRTKDHYKKHPTKENLWTYVGRVDDMIVLSNGEKFIPVGMEHLLSAHPLVKSALVVGQARFQCGLILELKDGVESDPKVIDDFWPFVEEANKTVPSHAQISRDLVILADPKKPFHRASKGTVQRYNTVKEYAPEIDALYTAFESRDPAANGPQAELSSAADAVAVQKFLEEVVGQILPGREIQDTDDFFVLGMDSLQTSQLSSTIKNTLKDKVEAAKTLGTRFVYENPSISQLRAAILSLATGKSSGESVSVEDKMRAMVEKYTSDLPAKSASKPKVDGKLNVVLTGSTGSLGFYIILALLDNPKIGRIYCLDRSAGCEKKFFDRWAVLGEERLTPAPGRIHFYQAEFGHPTFGLEDVQYSKIYNNANVIIHNAWKVNFNHPLTSFDSQIRSVKAFAHLSLTSPLHPEFCFVSSISTMGSYSGVAPESVVPDYTAPSPMGYGHSKYVSERILEQAAREHGVNMTVFRVGQIAGPILRGDKGKWNLQEWFPSLVKTSGELGIIPTTLGNMDAVDWVPVDVLGRVMVELIQLPPNNPTIDGAKVYNMVNPHQSTFTELVPAIKAYYAGKGKTLTEVSYAEWLDEIKNLGEDEATLERFPAKKVQSFFENLLEGEGEGGIFETEHLVQDSANMKALTSVNREWVDTWLAQWAY